MCNEAHKQNAVEIFRGNRYPADTVGDFHACLCQIHRLVAYLTLPELCVPWIGTDGTGWDLQPPLRYDLQH